MVRCKKSDRETSKNGAITRSRIGEERLIKCNKFDMEDLRYNSLM